MVIQNLGQKLDYTGSVDCLRRRLELGLFNYSRPRLEERPEMFEIMGTNSGKQATSLVKETRFQFDIGETRDGRGSR